MVSHSLRVNQFILIHQTVLFFTFLIVLKEVPTLLYKTWRRDSKLKANILFILSP